MCEACAVGCFAEIEVLDEESAKSHGGLDRFGVAKDEHNVNVIGLKRRENAVFLVLGDDVGMQ